MTTPIATVADALIAFILSLLRDPDAVAEFNAAPQAAMDGAGLGDVCGADVRAVKPVVVDHPSVTPKPPGPPGPPPPDPPDEVVKEITRILNQFTTIDNRSTIVDQSVNQNIWTEGGDVTQIFDQEAVIASGDDSVAAGDDATIGDADIDVTVGDVSIGNTTNDNSFNTTGGDADAEPVAEAPAEPVADPAAVDPATVDPAAEATGDAVTEAVDAALDTTVAAAPPAEDPLAADLTSTDTYESDLGGGGEEEAYVEEPTEEQ